MTTLTRTMTTGFEIEGGELAASAAVDLDGLTSLVIIEGEQEGERADLYLAPREARRLAVALLDAAGAAELATEQPTEAP